MSYHLKAFKIKRIRVGIAVEEEYVRLHLCCRSLVPATSSATHLAPPQLAISCRFRWRFLYKMLSRATSSNSQDLSGMPFIRKVFIST